MILVCNSHLGRSSPSRLQALHLSTIRRDRPLAESQRSRFPHVRRHSRELGRGGWILAVVRGRIDVGLKLFGGPGRENWTKSRLIQSSVRRKRPTNEKIMKESVCPSQNRHKHAIEARRGHHFSTPGFPSY